ncbi:hypothetical protein CPC08DRAFT_794704 [Agrocybe pediades]|nr:hypothetical protein CPC08DRAFT_794704 [Agrocybe pediades]
MSALESSIAQATSDIWGRMLALPLKDRRVLGALLKWKPDVSEWLSNTLQCIDLAWARQEIIDDYLVFLHNLEQRVQRMPINWTDIADSNIELEALEGRVSQLSPTSALQRRTQDRGERSRSLSFFNNADQVAIFGGRLKLYDYCTPRCRGGDFS